MGFLDNLKGQFVDIIEWIDPSNDTIAYRFERHKNEIKMGAKLTVRPGQMAVFVNEGQIADVFPPGMYELSTQNLPILSTLKGWKYGFNSPFKAEVYFFSTKVFTNLKWGTSNPITIRDSELGPIRLKAYGNYTFKVEDGAKLLEEIVSTDGLFQVDEITDHLRNVIITSFASWVGGSKIPLLDFAANYRSMGNDIRQAMQGDMLELGIELRQLLVENISLPKEVEDALDKRASMGLIGNLQQYSQYQTAQAIEDSAKNSSGGNMGLEMGMGMVMANQMMNTMQQQQQPPQQQPSPSPSVFPPSPPPIQAEWHLYQNGQQTGPFSFNQLSQQGLTAQTQVWKTGMEGWKMAADVMELQSLLPKASPPPPPSVPSSPSMPSPPSIDSPPPSPSNGEKGWYILINGEKKGPFTERELFKQKISPNTQVWKNGMEGWKLASEVPDLAFFLI
jgi:membrane protease subunit (stomatin/prohibitin family)